jgi:transcriptional regulator with XRE-family HTH domain
MSYYLDAEQMGQRLKELRGDRPRKEVAKAVGISESALAWYEAGKRIPRDKVKMRLANYYGKSLLTIFFSNKPTL